MKASMILAIGLLVFASTAINQVELLKFRKAPAQAGPVPPPPPPSPQQEVIDDSRLLQPYLVPAPPAPLFASPPIPAIQYQQTTEYIRQEPLPAAGVKGAAAAASSALEQQLPATTKGRVQQAPAPLVAPIIPAQQHHETIAYLVVRPSFKYQNYYNPSLAAYTQSARYAQPALLAPRPFDYYPATTGFRQEQQQVLQATKGGPIKQQVEEQQQIIEQQREEQSSVNAPAPAPAPPAPQPAIVVPIQAKEGRLKAMIDRIISKITLGSSYHVASEEFVQPPLPQPVPQPHQQQLPIEQQQIEQQQVVEQDQRFESQQQLPLEQQRQEGFGEEQIKSAAPRPQLNDVRIEQQQQQQQIKEEQQLQQSLAEQQDLLLRQQQADSKGSNLLASRQTALEQQQQQLSFESSKEAKQQDSRFNGHQLQQQQQQQQLTLVQEPAKGF